MLQAKNKGLHFKKTHTYIYSKNQCKLMVESRQLLMINLGFLQSMAKKKT